MNYRTLVTTKTAFFGAASSFYVGTELLRVTKCLCVLYTKCIKNMNTHMNIWILILILYTYEYIGFDISTNINTDIDLVFILIQY